MFVDKLREPVERNEENKDLELFRNQDANLLKVNFLKVYLDFLPMQLVLDVALKMWSEDYRLPKYL